MHIGTKNDSGYIDTVAIGIAGDNVMITLDATRFCRLDVDLCVQYVRNGSA